ncbi:hypothetical protein D3C86_1192310 [compost metagenome]
MGLAGNPVACHGQIIERAQRVLHPFQRLEIAGAAATGRKQVGEELGGVAQALGADAQVVARVGVLIGQAPGALFHLMVQVVERLGGEPRHGVDRQGRRLDPGGRFQHQQAVARRLERAKGAIIGLSSRGQQASTQRRQAGRGGVLRRRVEDVADEDVQIAGAVGLVRQPFQLGLDAPAIRLGQQGLEDDDGGAQAAQAHAHLMHRLGSAHDAQQFGVGRDLGQTGLGDGAECVAGRGFGRQGRGRGAARRATAPLGQAPAAFGLALEHRDDGQVARQTSGQGEEDGGVAALQFQLQLVDGLAPVAPLRVSGRQLARVEGGLDQGAVQLDHADAPHHRGGEARRQVGAAAFQQPVRGGGFQRGEVRGLGGDRDLPLVAGGLAGGGLTLQGLDEAAGRDPHPQAEPGRAQHAVGGVEIDRAQGLAGLLPLQGRVPRQAHDRARPEPELQFSFGCGRGHGANLRLSPSSRKRRSSWAILPCAAGEGDHAQHGGGGEGGRCRWRVATRRGSFVEEGACIRPLHRLRRSPSPVNGGGLAGQSRATWKPANDWLTGINSSALTFRCGGRVATQNRVSAMSSPVIGFAPS